MARDELRAINIAGQRSCQYVEDRLEGERCLPKVFCDECGQVIERAQDGNYEWLHNPVPGREGLYFTHKTCSNAFEAQRGGRAAWWSGELRWLPAYLAYNLAITPALSDRYVKQLALI